MNLILNTFSLAKVISLVYLCLIISMISDKEQTYINKQENMINQFKATMVLAAVGDAMGYRRGMWEFNKKGVKIHEDMMSMTDQAGIKGLKLNYTDFPYSDDTVMHIATAQGLLQSLNTDSEDEICRRIAKHYKSCMQKMKGRAPGMTCIRSTNILKNDGSNWKDIHFEKNGGGCGASMRAACIGLYYHKDQDMDKLIQISIETGRTTHHNPIGYLGSFVSALFTVFAVRGIDPRLWLSLLLSTYLPKAKEYVRNNRQSEQNISSGFWDSFENYWKMYAGRRNMQINFPSEPCFPDPYGVEQRQQEYKKLSVNGWPGALGVDSVIIAYDALLSSLDYCNKKGKLGIKINRWEQVCLRGVLHGGDNDSTGTIVGAWYGALFGFEEVFECNYINSEKREYIEQLGEKIYKKVYRAKLELGKEK